MLESAPAERADTPRPPVVVPIQRQPEACSTTPVRPPDGLDLPNQRRAAFNPLRVSTVAPPNPYLAAERRQQANYRRGTTLV
ncbi:MAG TPA: hypothetical protein VHC43_03570 [Mycobacteriales bacterium]|nr:hypothetical protein [Mycobacteriales bacterium]